MPAEFLATGETLPDLFKNASEQLLEWLMDPADVGEALQEKLILEAATPSDLLRDYLNGLLGLLRNQHIIFRSVRFQDLQGEDNPRLKADILGELLDPHRHEWRHSPAATRCETAHLDGSKGQWRAQITIFFEKH